MRLPYRRFQGTQAKTRVKHAFLILAHHEFDLLRTLISCLDDARNDIYLHIDAKVPAIPVLKTEKASLHIIAQRTDIRWGDCSMIEAEYALFEKAASQGPYAYYHLLSGVDLPIKSQDDIHGFFDANAGREFIGYSETNPDELSRRMQLWHIFPRHFSRRRNLYSLPRSLCLRAQLLLGMRRNRDIVFKKGSQWFSVTEKFARYLLENKEWAMRTFPHTFVPDESLAQTLCWNSPFRDHLYSTASDAEGCMRAIGWKDGHLEDWTREDSESLAASPAMFARKFNSSDPEFIERIVQMVKQ